MPVRENANEGRQLAAERPIETDGWRQVERGLVNHVCSLSGIPARLIGS